jgi:hypothetical protein
MAIRRLLTAFCVVALSFPCPADDDVAAVRLRVKAAFIYKFASFVEWPPESFPDDASPIVIGVSGGSGMARELGDAVGRQAGTNRSMLVRMVDPGQGPAGCCQILYIGRESGSAATRRLLAEVAGKPVLTVTDMGDDHPEGSVINFVDEAERVRFDISRQAAERNGLQLRSQLLGVARRLVSR